MAAEVVAAAAPAREVDEFRLRYDDLYDNAIRPALIGRVASTTPNLAKVQAADVAVYQKTRDLMLELGVNTFDQLYTTTSTTFNKSDAISFRMQWESFVARIHDVRFYIDDQGRKCDRVSSFSPAAHLSICPDIQSRIILMRVHLPRIGIYDASTQMSTAMTLTANENAVHAYQSGLLYATAVRKHADLTSATMSVLPDIKAVNLADATVKPVPFPASRFPVFPVKDHTDVVFGRPAATQVMRLAIAELARLPQQQVRAERFLPLSERVAQHQQQCNRAVVESGNKLRARVSEFVAFGVKVRTECTVHVHVRQDIKTLSRLKPHAQSTAKFAAEYALMERLLVAKDKECHDIVAAMAAGIPTNIAALWEAHCTNQIALFDAEFMSRELTAAFARDDSKTSPDGWSPIDIKLQFAATADKQSEALVRDTDGASLDKLTVSGVKALRDISAGFVARWNAHWASDVPNAMAASVRAVTDAEQTLKLTRFTAEVNDPHIGERCRNWLSRASALEASPMRFVSIPTALGQSHTVGDFMSHVIPPYLRPDLPMPTIDVIRSTLVVFACSKPTTKKTQKEIEQQIGMMD